MGSKIIRIGQTMVACISDHQLVSMPRISIQIAADK